MQRGDYRPDIDGLRAVAVVAVLFFHAGIPGFPGGFVGVDIFFVISGFLITGVIAREIDDGRFSILRFYERRARRILPALLVVVAVVLAGAAWLYLPGDFEPVPRSALAALLSLSNVFFFSEVGYFDTAAEFKPLLHTWSLGVEEQFYVGFPILLLLVRHAAPRVRKGAVAAVALVSFAWAVAMRGDQSGFAFYLLPTRAWELFTGGLLALGVMPAVHRLLAREIITLLGAVAIAAAVMLFDKHADVPGFAALAPVLGAAALIHCAPGTRVGRLLTLRPMVGIGLVSYSLYLWHWPLLAFARYAADRPLTLGEACGLLLLAGGLSVLSWRFVERPFRRGWRHLRAAAVLAWSGAGVAALSCVVIAMIVAGPWPGRFDATTARLAMAHYDVSPFRDRCHDAFVAGHSPCTLGARAVPDAIVWGDSHGVEISYAIARAAAAHGQAVVERTQSSCPPVIGYAEPGEPRCALENGAVIAAIEHDPHIRTVYLAAFWASPAYWGQAFSARLDATIARLRADGRQVVIFGPVPPNRFDVPRHLAHLSWRGDLADARGRTRDEIQRDAWWVERVLARWRGAPGVRVVEPLDLLCPAGPCALMAHGQPLYFDNHHLSTAGAELVVSGAGTSKLASR